MLGGLWAVWLLLVAAAPAVPQPSPEGAVDNRSRFQRTIAYLQAAEPAERADFAADALAQLAEVYLAEADLAHADALRREGSGRAKLLGWSLAVNQYADQLLLVLDEIEQGFEVSLLLAREGPVTVTVAGRAVILGHPRADQQAAYEQRVLADYCSRYDCARMMAVAAVAEPIPVTVGRVNPVWTFSGTGPVCANEGLEVRFGNSQNLGTLRGICEQLLQELAALATELAWQQRHAVAIEWDALSITPTPQRPEHIVRLNAAGDSVLLTLPLLFGSPGLLADVTPWLRERVAGAQAPRLQLDAATYGWQ